MTSGAPQWGQWTSVKKSRLDSSSERGKVVIAVPSIDEKGGCGTHLRIAFDPTRLLVPRDPEIPRPRHNSSISWLHHGVPSIMQADGSDGRQPGPNVPGGSP